MIQLIISDLDSTLLNDQKEISDYTKKVIHQLREQGIQFIIATARPKEFAEKLVAGLPFDAAVFQNGAHIQYANKKETFVHLDTEDVQATIKDVLAHLPRQKIAVETVDGRFANFDCLPLWPDSDFQPHAFPEPLTKDVLKILLPLEAGTIEYLERLENPAIKVTIAEGTLAMITHPQATKLDALRKIWTEMNLSEQQAVAFGDDLNDCDMLQTCKIGVAVANALPEVKNVADVITLDNNHDGVAKWLAGNLLK